MEVVECVKIEDRLLKTNTFKLLTLWGVEQKAVPQEYSGTDC